MLNFILFTVLLLPVIFQLIVGTMASKASIPFKFWHISLISLLGQVASAVFNLLFINELLTRNGSRDGLPFVGMFILELIAGSILLIIIFIQGYVQFRKNKSRNE